MANNLADNLETKLLDYMLHTANSTNMTAVGTQLWVGLSTATPTDTVTNECTASGYARKQIAFATASSGSAQGPTATCTFDMATANWSTISGYCVFDAQTGSTGATNYLFHGAVSPTVAVTSNDTVSFAPSAMTLSFE